MDMPNPLEGYGNEKNQARAGLGKVDTVTEVGTRTRHWMGEQEKKRGGETGTYHRNTLHTHTFSFLFFFFSLKVLDFLAHV